MNDNHSKLRAEIESLEKDELKEKCDKLQRQNNRLLEALRNSQCAQVSKELELRKLRDESAITSPQLQPVPAPVVPNAPGRWWRSVLVKDASPRRIYWECGGQTYSTDATETDRWGGPCQPPKGEV